MTNTVQTRNDVQTRNEAPENAIRVRELAGDECEKVDGGVGMLWPAVQKIGGGGGPAPRYGCFLGVTC